MRKVQSGVDETEVNLFMAVKRGIVVLWPVDQGSRGLASAT